MSAVSEDFMRKPSDERDNPRAGDTPQAGADDDSPTSVWQWLAIVVLLACWLAEATLCAGQGL